MTIEKWLNKFIDETDLDREHIFEINYEGTLHSMDFETVVNSIIALPAENQRKIKNTIVKIDSHNGNIMHYLNYVAEGLVKFKS